MYQWPPLDDEVKLNRNHYEQALQFLFEKNASGVYIPPEDRPQVPGCLIPSIINRSVSELFPDGISLSISDEQYNDLLSELEKQLNLIKKCETIGMEGHITGTVGLKSIFNKDAQKWELDILPKESMLIECLPNNSEVITQITIRYRYEVIEKEKPVKYWHQERWSKTNYWEWQPRKDNGLNTDPGFTDDNYDTGLSGANPYAEIPITIITHKYDITSPYGLGMINEKLRMLDKAYTLNVSGVAEADQWLSIPTLVRLNDISKDKAVRYEVGRIIDIQSSDPNMQADLKALQVYPTPESVFTNREAIKAIAYELAQVINPDLEKDMKAGGTQSSKAYRMFYKLFLNLIGTLRLQYGRDGVEAHLHRIIRMSKAISLPDYGPIADEIKVSIVYPPEFEPDAAEKMGEIGAIKAANLPANEAAQRFAALFNITSQAIIDEIATNLEKEQAMLEASTLDNNGNA